MKISEVLSENNPMLRDNEELRKIAVIPKENVNMELP